MEKLCLALLIPPFVRFEEGRPLVCREEDGGGGVAWTSSKTTLSSSFSRVDDGRVRVDEGRFGLEALELDISNFGAAGRLEAALDASFSQ